MKVAITAPDGSYRTTVREFTSLRSAGEFVRDLPAEQEFLEIRAMDITPLDDQEKGAFAFFTEGKVNL